MARRKKAPYRLQSQNGYAVLDFDLPDGRRKKVYLGLPYTLDRSGPEERRQAEQAAEAEWRRLTDGRVVEQDGRVKTHLTFAELYAVYLRQWTPPEDATENVRQKLQAELIVRRAYGAHLTSWASSEATRPDGSKMWNKDPRTPLQRIVADGAPAEFLAWRLLSVKRKTMRKEKSNLVRFLGWAQTNKYLASVPTVALPSGKGTASPVMKKRGSGAKLDITPLEARQVVAALPVKSSRGGFRVRSFFDFMSLTGLRPATIERLELGRNWSPGSKALRLEDEDDKAAYGREIPLPSMACEILERIAKEDKRRHGHIWGHHDFRKHIAKAAKLVFKNDPVKREKFGAYHFRHFVATFLAKRAGSDLTAAQFMLGHKDLTTTSGYVRSEGEAASALVATVEADIRRADARAQKWAKGL